MISIQFKAYISVGQELSIDTAIRVCQFIRNKSLRLWIDRKAKGCYDLTINCSSIAAEFDFARKLNSQARQAAAERAWASISKFYTNCKNKTKGPKGYPKFQKDCRSVEYKTQAWKLSDDRKYITFTDKIGIGKVKLRGPVEKLRHYTKDQIKRVRLIKRADGYYVQFCVSVNRTEEIIPSGQCIGIDVGLTNFYTDSLGNTKDNPRFLKKSEEILKKLQRHVSKKKKGSSNRKKAKTRLGKLCLKVSRRRKDHAIKLARCVIMSNDIVVYENLKVKSMTHNHCLAKAIGDVSWYQFRVWLEYFAKIFGRTTIAVNPAYTSQECSRCGGIVKKSLSTRTHICQCGFVIDRDHNAAINILKKGLSTVGNTETFALDASNASGELASGVEEVILSC